MIKYHYIVKLKGYTTSVLAFNKEEATILAQAEAIKEGKDYNLISVERGTY